MWELRIWARRERRWAPLDSIGFAAGSPVTLAIRPSTGTAEISSAGDKPLVKDARFVLSTDSTPVGGGIPEHAYLTDRVPLDGGFAQAATFQYLTPTAFRLPLQISGPGGTVGQVLVAGHR